MKKVRYGIVGIGKQGTFYTKMFTKLGFLLPGAELTAVCDISEDRRAYAEKNLKGVKVFSDYNEMFASGLIYVCILTQLPPCRSPKKTNCFNYENPSGALGLFCA